VTDLPRILESAVGGKFLVVFSEKCNEIDAETKVAPARGTWEK